MRKIVEYICVSDKGTMGLTNQVNALIDDGFEPLGHTCISSDVHHNYFVQAMVKYDDWCPLKEVEE